MSWSTFHRRLAELDDLSPEKAERWREVARANMAAARARIHQWRLEVPERREGMHYRRNADLDERDFDMLIYWHVEHWTWKRIADRFGVTRRTAQRSVRQAAARMPGFTLRKGRPGRPPAAE